MLRRSLAALVTAVSAFGVVALPTAGPASAEGACTFAPPARIAIYADDTELPAKITGDCVPDGYGFWFTGIDDFEDANFAAAIFFGGESDAFLEVPDVLDHYGRQKWGAAGAVSDASCEDDDGGWWHSGRTPASMREHARTASAARAQSECNELTQNEPFSDVRLGTYAAISGTRNTASKVTVTVTSAIWSTGLNKLINRSAKGIVQTQYADGSWHNVGNTITTGSSGKATFAVGLPRRTIRFAVYSTPYSFNRVSTPITR